ncbi:cytochrome P450 71D8-like, partial [Phalaenopsis equestris]|uniref:cytochrome P450 71D8-like n=1 Tax=Phalaenopsis equestris TaxID=78828 RepID=UPI0009E45305
MKTHDINFASRPELLASKIICYNSMDIGFAPYGKYWSQLRKICTVEVLGAKRVQSFSFIRKEEGDNLVDRIRRARGSPVNLKEMFLALTSATISRAAFGKDCAHQEKFLNATREAFRHLSGFDIVDFFPSLGFIGKLTGSRTRLERVHQHLDEILNEILEEHQAKNSQGDDSGEDIVDVLLRLQKHGQLDIPLSSDNIKAVILVNFILLSQ